MKLLMCCHFPPLPGSKTMAQSIKLGEWKMHATAEPDKSVRFGEFCLRVPDDSHRTSSKSVTQRPMKSAHLTKQTTQQPTTEPTDLGSPSTQQTTEPDYFLIPETLPTRQPYADIIVRQIAPLNLQSHDYLLLAGCYCDKSEKKHLNETSALLSLMMQFPSETCTSAEYIGELKDGSKVCMTRLSFLDYYNAISSPQPEPANEGSSYEEPLVRSPTLLDPTTELPITTHPSVTESKQHDPTDDPLQMTQAPQHTTHGCESCNFKTHSDDIDPKAVQSVNVTMQSSSCPLHIYVSLKDEDFCLDLDWPPFMRMLMKLEKEILSAHEDWMPKNISSCHCQERETKSPNETSPVTSTRIWLPSETCISTEFIETLMDGREVCVIGSNILAYFGIFSHVPAESHQITSLQSSVVETIEEPILCGHCQLFPNLYNIEPNDVQSVKMDVGSLPCPIYLHVTLKKKESFCVDSSQPWFRTLLEKLKI